MYKIILFLGLLIPYNSFANDEERAVKHVLKALYVDSKLEKKVKEELKPIEKDIPEEVKYFIPLYSILVEKKIQYKWEF